MLVHQATFCLYFFFKVSMTLFVPQDLALEYFLELGVCWAHPLPEESSLEIAAFCLADCEPVGESRLVCCHRRVDDAR